MRGSTGNAGAFIHPLVGYTLLSFHDRSGYEFNLCPGRSKPQWQLLWQRQVGGPLIGTTTLPGCCRCCSQPQASESEWTDRFGQPTPIPAGTQIWCQHLIGSRDGTSHCRIDHTCFCFLQITTISRKCHKLIYRTDRNLGKVVYSNTTFYATPPNAVLPKCKSNIQNSHTLKMLNMCMNSTLRNRSSINRCRHHVNDSSMKSTTPCS